MTLPLSFRASASFVDVEELCSGLAAWSSPRPLINSRLHVSDRRSVLVREYATMDSGGLWAGVGQSPRCVTIFPVCRARNRQVDHLRQLDDCEEQPHGVRFREGDKSGRGPYYVEGRIPLILDDPPRRGNEPLAGMAQRGAQPMSRVLDGETQWRSTPLETLVGWKLRPVGASETPGPRLVIRLRRRITLIFAICPEGSSRRTVLSRELCRTRPASQKQTLQRDAPQYPAIRLHQPRLFLQQDPRFPAQRRK